MGSPSAPGSSLTGSSHNTHITTGTDRMTTHAAETEYNPHDFHPPESPEMSTKALGYAIWQQGHVLNSLMKRTASLEGRHVKANRPMVAALIGIIVVLLYIAYVLSVLAHRFA